MADVDPLNNLEQLGNFRTKLNAIRAIVNMLNGPTGFVTKAPIDSPKFTTRMDLNNAAQFSLSFRNDGSNQIGWYVGAGGAADGSQVKVATIIKTTGVVYFTNIVSIPYLQVAPNGFNVTYQTIGDFTTYNNSGRTTWSTIRVMQYSTGIMAIEAANQANTKLPLVLQPYGGKIGIGTPTPAGRFHVSFDETAAWGAAWNGGFAVFGGSGPLTGGLGLSYSDSAGGEIGAIIPGGAWKPLTFRGGIIVFRSDGVNERARFDINGNLGIGTTSPSARLHVRPATDVNLEMGVLSTAMRFEILNDARNSYIPLRIQAGSILLNPASGVVAIGGAAATHKLAVYGGASGGIISFVPTGATALEIYNSDVSKSFAMYPITSGSDSDMAIYSNSGTPGTRVFIKGAAPVVGIGTTNPGAGLEIQGAANGSVRLRHGSTYSDVAHQTDVLYITNSVANGIISFYQATLQRWNIASGGHLLAGADNQYDIGSASFRPRQIYAGTSTISTSDAREKTPVKSFTAKEISAARALAREIGVYQWLQAVAEKGELARYHIGMTVQRAIEVMEAHGLNPWAYGFICKDDVYENYEDVELVEVQATEDSTEQYEEVQVVNGKPIQFIRTRNVKVPKFNMVQVTDEAGKKITKTVRVEVGRDTFGQTKYENKIEPVMHPVPVMVEVEQSVTKQRKIGDRYGFRYEQLIAFMLAGVVQEIDNG